MESLLANNIVKTILARGIVKNIPIKVRQQIWRECSLGGSPSKPGRLNFAGSVYQDHIKEVAYQKASELV